jgi:hypothetical protein
MGARTRMMKPRSSTSSTMMYMMPRIPKMSHHRCGEVRLQVFREVYSNMCAIKNQLRVRRDERRVSLGDELGGQR